MVWRWEFLIKRIFIFLFLSIINFKYEIKLDIKSLKETNLKLEDVYLEEGKTLEYNVDEENSIVTITRIKPLMEIKEETKCIDNVTVKINWPFGNSDSSYDKIN